MRYLPKSPADRDAMLKAIGIRSIDELFSPVPAEYRLARDLKVPRQMAESERKMLGSLLLEPYRAAADRADDAPRHGTDRSNPPIQ